MYQVQQHVQQHIQQQMQQSASESGTTENRVFLSMALCFHFLDVVKETFVEHQLTFEDTGLGFCMFCYCSARTSLRKQGMLKDKSVGLL